MEKIVVKGGKKLSGEIEVSAAKNSVLPIIVASILTSDDIVIKNTPILEDVEVLKELITHLNGSISHDKNGSLYINTKNINDINADCELIRKMRASFLVMGPTLARFGRCKISLPGGCNIGTRPIDLHLKGFKALGAEIDMGYGYVEAKAKKLKGNTIYLDFPSVGATENLIMAAALAEGTTVIENAAEEPEVWDLINFINAMGGKIYSEGLGKIVIDGVDALKGIEYSPIYDRIEAGTYMIAAAITGSKITIKGGVEDHLKATTEKLKEMGVDIISYKDRMIVDATKRILKPSDIKTLPYPGFPTDMQAQFMSLLSIVNGTSVISENIFENRFMHVGELSRMGANIKTEGKVAIVEGVNTLTGCNVKATDLRAGAAMILAGLVASGETIISDIYHIDRGYYNIENKLKSVGAEIYRINS